MIGIIQCLRTEERINRT